MPKENVVFSIVYNITLGVLGIILLIFFVKPALSTFNIFQFTGDDLTGAFATLILPVAGLFIIIYMLINQFTEV